MRSFNFLLCVILQFYVPICAICGLFPLIFFVSARSGVSFVLVFLVVYDRIKPKPSVHDLVL